MATYVRVRTGAETYALPVHQVHEVAELSTLTPVPGANASALGILNLRGEILPVFDLAAVLGVDGAMRRRRLIVVEANEQRIGLAIDDVISVADLPPAIEKTESNLLSGSVIVDDEVVGFLNLFVIIEVLRVELSR